MTIQTPEAEAEAPAMTRREAYDTMIQHCRTLLDLSNEHTEGKSNLSALKGKLPNFHSVSSFDELEAMEQLAEQLKPETDALSTRINDIEVEMEVLRASIRGILKDYGFKRIQFISFDHGETQWRIHVKLWLDAIESDAKNLIRLASTS